MYDTWQYYKIIIFTKKKKKNLFQGGQTKP